MRYARYTRYLQVRRAEEVQKKLSESLAKVAALEGDLATTARRASAAEKVAQDLQKRLDGTASSERARAAALEAAQR